MIVIIIIIIIVFYCNIIIISIFIIITMYDCQLIYLSIDLSTCIQWQYIIVMIIDKTHHQWYPRWMANMLLKHHPW